MLGSRVGARFQFTGASVGTGADDEGISGIAGVTRDASSGKYFPANSTEWGTFLTAIGSAMVAPNDLWLMQDPSGNPADAIGALPQTATAVLNYQQAVSGYSRLMIASTDGGSGKSVLGTGVGPSPATTSQLWLGVINMPATPAANRAFFGINVASGTNAVRLLHLTASGILRLNVVGVNTDSAGAYSAGTHIMIVQYDRTNLVANCYTEIDKLVGTYAATATDGDKGAGNAGAGTASGRGLLYQALWSGAPAEVTSSALKTLVNGLGWGPVSWS